MSAYYNKTIHHRLDLLQKSGSMPSGLKRWQEAQTCLD